MRKAKSNHFSGDGSATREKVGNSQRCEIKKNTFLLEGVLSEWPDSNGRPLAPHARMLANCTTPRNCKNALQRYNILLFLQVFSRQLLFSDKT